MSKIRGQWLARKFDLIVARDRMHGILEHDGPALIEAARGDGSLRDLAKRSKLSATYLSLVRAGEQRISHSAFCRLVDCVRGGSDA